MCGIAGYITTKKHTDFAKSKFTSLLLNGEERGGDASGIAFNVGKGRYFYLKTPLTASKFVTDKYYLATMKKYNPTLLIGHNRAKTQGDEKDNNNNHPIITKSGLMLIHNGILWNEDEVKKDFNLKTDGEVDSEVIVRLIEHYKYKKGFTTTKAIRMTMKKLRGSFACALLNAKEPSTLYLWLSGNPLSLAYHKKTKTIFFASTEDILKKSLFEHKSYREGLFQTTSTKKEYVFKELEDDYGLVITPHKHTFFEIETAPYQSTIDNNNQAISKFVSPSQTPLIAEADGDNGLSTAILKQDEDFNLYEIIKRPSGYFSEFLLLRLEYLQDLFVTRDYEKYLDEKEVAQIETEVRRIINTLSIRKKITKREIYVPTEKEILVPTVLYSKILTSKNKDILPNLRKTSSYKDWLQLEFNARSYD